jgi:Cu(I)/Ag(I) efflux system membrane protein CusA/SilA
MPDRSALARYGLMIGNVQEVISTALGGETITNNDNGRGAGPLWRQYSLSARFPLKADFGPLCS